VCIISVQQAGDPTYMKSVLHFSGYIVEAPMAMQDNLGEVRRATVHVMCFYDRYRCVLTILVPTYKLLEKHSSWGIATSSTFCSRTDTSAAFNLEHETSRVVMMELRKSGQGSSDLIVSNSVTEVLRLRSLPWPLTTKRRLDLGD